MEDVKKSAWNSEPLPLSRRTSIQPELEIDNERGGFAEGKGKPSRGKVEWLNITFDLS